MKTKRLHDESSAEPLPWKCQTLGESVMWVGSGPYFEYLFGIKGHRLVKWHSGWLVGPTPNAVRR